MAFDSVRAKIHLISISSTISEWENCGEYKLTEETSKMTVTHVQKLHLELIKRANFNSFNGNIVANGLLANADSWTAVIAAHSYRSHPVYRLFEEIPEDEWSPDTLWIMAVDDQAATQLMALCRQWGAEQVGIYDFTNDPQLHNLAMIDDEVLVRAWWD